MMERLSRRNEGMAAEYARFSSALSGLTESSQETYAVDTNDVPLLNEGMNATARHLDSSRQLLEDEARGWEEGVLEDLKRQRDTLVSVRDMFDRRDKYARDNIPQLEKRIANNETKLQNIRQKTPEQIKPGEAEKVEDAIFKVSHYHSFPSHVFFF
jgi:sorting nexin-8